MMASFEHRLLYIGSLAAARNISRSACTAACRLTALAAALGAQDAYTRGHARRVADYAERMAQHLGLPHAETETIRFGGLLHDIGKIAFSPDLLSNTQSQLSNAMRAEIQRHPEIGSAFLRANRVSEDVIDGVRCHHERMDGSGYPRGLTADEIPLSARIISVADCFDALTTDRSYQKGKSVSEALNVMGELQLAPEMIKVLRDEVRRNGLTRTRWPHA
jgi:putative nucleotidyltransferase with HDIG domain